MASVAEIIALDCRVPEGMNKHLGLASKKCVPCEAGKGAVLSDAQINSYRNQTPGWQIITNAQGHQCLRQQWKVKNFKAGLEVFDRIGQIAEAEGHHPDLHLEGYNTVAADLSTHSVGKCLVAEVCNQRSCLIHPSFQLGIITLLEILHIHSCTELCQLDSLFCACRWVDRKRLCHGIKDQHTGLDRPSTEKKGSDVLPLTIDWRKRDTYTVNYRPVRHKAYQML